MLRTLAITGDGEKLENIPLRNLTEPRIKWFWVDFDCPTEEETKLLDSYFHFHPLAIEDCMHLLQRPKLDHYEDTHFFVIHGIDPVTLKAQEINYFLGPRGIVSFHLEPASEVDEAWRRMQDPSLYSRHDHHYVAYLIMDKLVDNYFPTLYRIEDHMNDLESREEEEKLQTLIDEVYDIRNDLLRLRRTVIPMRDLLYRTLNSDKIPGIREHIAYFTDVYDHLLKLTDMIESDREMTADLRDSYDSMRSSRMNMIMKTLTVITTIFMPLTFIAGLYGMNFHYMPELYWRWGYFTVLGVMAVLGFGMYFWFRRKGWFD
ncbi:magnesium/cobalt transporter CorA [Cohnella sp. CFH 77786]|uniref:magnesium/cobalt transporter CorA n=1 Tax=Cohnella sp. CFH 77786 TaxID=2662265 RepID=UPI001C608462|nr:magnesium/cobalt transporter CorA [Cohnella sp. CFH 77786]MBW5448290.1 magnesium/cobalt transporter CorA [Cohnella sp. CFH 77786]